MKTFIKNYMKAVGVVCACIEGKPILKVAKEGLTAMANAAFRDVSFMLRRSHNR